MSKEVCYVKGGISCARNARSDSVIPDVAWRECSQDCYGVGSSFLPATRASCSCFNESKPDRFEKRSRISIFNDVYSQPSIHAIASQMLKVLIEEKLGIPTEIGTEWLTYYDNPIDDMAGSIGLGASIHIMPGVDKTRADYRDSWQTRVYDDRRVVSAGSLGAPLKTGFYVQRSVVERLYAPAHFLDQPFARPPRTFFVARRFVQPGIGGLPRDARPGSGGGRRLHGTRRR
jgi:hypothetical protein